MVLDLKRENATLTPHALAVEPEPHVTIPPEHAETGDAGVSALFAWTFKGSGQ